MHRKAFGFHRDVDRILEDALSALKSAGAVLVDPANIPQVGEYDESEFLVLLYELKADLAAYLDTLVPPRLPLLEAMEAEAARTRFPIIGPAAGHFCYLMARMIGATSVFELGSGFGYSTAWFARSWPIYGARRTSALCPISWPGWPP